MLVLLIYRTLSSFPQCGIFFEGFFCYFDLNSIRWDFCWNIDVDISNSGNVLSGFEIEMKSTTQQSLSSWSNNNLATYFGPASYTDQIGWNHDDFSSPFYWDGTSNIVIQTCFYNNGWSQNAVMNMSNYGYNSLIYRRRDNSSPCNSNWINGVETQNLI